MSAGIFAVLRVFILHENSEIILFRARLLPYQYLIHLPPFILPLILWSLRYWKRNINGSVIDSSMTFLCCLHHFFLCKCIRQGVTSDWRRRMLNKISQICDWGLCVTVLRLVTRRLDLTRRWMEVFIATVCLESPRTGTSERHLRFIACLPVKGPRKNERLNSLLSILKFNYAGCYVK